MHYKCTYTISCYLPITPANYVVDDNPFSQTGEIVSGQHNQNALNIYEPF